MMHIQLSHLTNPAVRLTSPMLPSQLTPKGFFQRCRTPCANQRALQISRFTTSSRFTALKKAKEVKRSNGEVGRAVQPGPNSHRARQIQQPQLQLNSATSNTSVYAGLSRRYGNNALLYRAPPHGLYYTMAYLVVMPSCFAMTAFCTYLWQNPPEGIPWFVPKFHITIAIFLSFLGLRAFLAPRSLIKEIWCLSSKEGTKILQPQIKIVTRPWPIPFMKEKEFVVPLNDVAISRHYGGIAVPELRAVHNHGLAQTMAKRNVSELARMEEEAPFFVKPFLNLGSKMARAFRDFQNIFFWGQAEALNNSFVVVNGKKFYKLDGRGVMLEGGNGK